MTQHITVPLPDRVSITTARRIAVEIEGVINRHTGALVEATVTDLALSDQERRVLVTALDTALDAVAKLGGEELRDVDVVVDLRARLDPDRREAIVSHAVNETNGHADLTRQQEYAADAMASEYGRSRVRHLADGAVVITGMTDDVERRSVCIERDGRERWRS